VVVEISGTLASGSFDKGCYDTSSGSSTPYNICTTSTTASASEIWIATNYNGIPGDANDSSFNQPSFFPATGGWTLIGNGFKDGTGAGQTESLFYQLPGATGTCGGTGTTVASGSNLIGTGCVTLR